MSMLLSERIRFDHCDGWTTWELFCASCNQLKLLHLPTICKMFLAILSVTDTRYHAVLQALQDPLEHKSTVVGHQHNTEFNTDSATATAGVLC